MAASVLGKRTRSARETEGSTTLTRAKRQSQLAAENDENVNPFVTRSTKPEVHNHDLVGINELASSIKATFKVAKATSVPLKHGLPECRVSVSPTKANAHLQSQPRKPSAASIDDIKQIQIRTPQTTRYRDALSKKGPVTPRRRVFAYSKAATPSIRRTPSKISAIAPTVYNTARRLFAQSAAPTTLVGRENERKELYDFLSQRVHTQTSGCIYISGPPGTGKSALVNEVCERYQASESVKAAYVNCIGVKGALDIYTRLIHKLCPELNCLEGDEIETLKTLFCGKASPQPAYLVTLDEIEYLLNLDLEVLYNLFQWSLEPSSALVLIGIANALDLTDRFLPRLKARRLKPHLLPFLPYKADEISSVITTRLRSLLAADSSVTTDHIPFIHPAAIQFVSKKVASQTGDLRKAFHICRRVLDLVETETRENLVKDAMENQHSSASKNVLSENINLSSPMTPPQTPSKRECQCPTPSLSELTPENAPRATIAHVARITSSIFNSGAASRLQTVNLQQKVVLCALLAFERKRREASKDVVSIHLLTPSKRSEAGTTTEKALYEAYRGYCGKEETLHPLAGTEFRDVVDSLEILGLVEGSEGTRAGSSSFAVYGTPSKRRKTSAGNGGGDSRRLGSCVSEREMVDCLQGMGPGSEICLSTLNGL